MLSKLQKGDSLESIAKAISKECKKSWLISVTEGKKGRFRKILITFSTKTGSTKANITGRYAPNDGRLIEVLKLDLTKTTKKSEEKTELANFVGEGTCLSLKEIAELLK